MPKQQGSGSIQQQIQDAIASGSAIRQTRDQQAAARQAAQQASASAADYSASLDDENTAVALMNKVTQKITAAVANGDAFCPLLEIKGTFNSSTPLPRRALKLKSKLEDAGLTVAVHLTPGSASSSMQLGVRF